MDMTTAELREWAEENKTPEGSGIQRLCISILCALDRLGALESVAREYIGASELYGFYPEWAEKFSAVLAPKEPPK